MDRGSAFPCVVVSLACPDICIYLHTALDAIPLGSEIRNGQVVVLDSVLDKTQLAAARRDVGRLHDGGR